METRGQHRRDAPFELNRPSPAQRQFQHDLRASTGAVEIRTAPSRSRCEQGFDGPSNPVAGCRAKKPIRWPVSSRDIIHAILPCRETFPMLLCSSPQWNRFASIPSRIQSELLRQSLPPRPHPPRRDTSQACWPSRIRIALHAPAWVQPTRPTAKGIPGASTSTSPGAWDTRPCATPASPGSRPVVCRSDPGSRSGSAHVPRRCADAPGSAGSPAA